MGELACPAEDDEQVDELLDEPVDEHVDEPVGEGGDEQVEFQEEEQPEQDLHAAEIMLRRVHTYLGMQMLLSICSLLPDIFSVPTVI